jgi:hypothetical protein
MEPEKREEETKGNGCTAAAAGGGSGTQANSPNGTIDPSSSGSEVDSRVTRNGPEVKTISIGGRQIRVQEFTGQPLVMFQIKDGKVKIIQEAKEGEQP